MPAVASSRPVSPFANVVRRRVTRVETDASSVICSFSDQGSLKLSRFVGGFVHAGDEIEFDPTARFL